MERTAMYCDQCQEAASGTACTRLGMCGIDVTTANLRDLLVFATDGLAAILAQRREEKAPESAEGNRLVIENMAMCNVNVNFDPVAYRRRLNDTFALSRTLRAEVQKSEELPEAANFELAEEEYDKTHRPISEDADIRGLRGLITYAIEGISSYLMNAIRLGKDDEEIHAFIQTSLAKTVNDKIRGGELIANVLEAGRYGIKAMNLLREAKEERFGAPEAIEVDRGIRSNPGILVVGDNLLDLELILKQSEGKGVDIYTYSDLISAHAYPELMRYSHFAGNYGGAWWKQKEDFENFRGPILVTSDELTVPRNTYSKRLFTTGLAGYPKCEHIEGEGENKDFSKIIELAQTCETPDAIISGTVMTGYGYDELQQFADTLSSALSSKEVRKLVVMTGTDGRARNRTYYTDFVKALPDDTVILTSGTIKYRFMEQELGECEGIPRMIDAGDAADLNNISDLLLTIQDKMNLTEIGQLPVYFNVSWYDSKSIINILELLYIGMKNIHLGPCSLTFLSRGIREVFVNYFGLKTIGDVDEDIRGSFGDRGDSVTADMLMGDIVADYPELIPVMLSMGLHCIGCGVSQMETLKEACEVHGLDAYDVLEVLNDELKHPEEEDED